MAREVSIDIRDIVNTNFDWKLTARIMLLWKEINEETKEITFMHMILIDKNGHKIHAKLNGPNIKRIDVPLTQGKIYTITKFKTWEINKGYRYTKHKYQIYLQQYSKLNIVEEAMETIPMHKFDFVDYSEVESYYEPENRDKCFNLIGKLHFAKDQRTRVVGNKQKPVRDIFLMNERKEILRVALWGKLGEEINPAVEANLKGEDVIVIVTFTTSNLFECKYHAQSSYGSNVLINYRCQEAEEFKRKTNNIDSSLKSTYEKTIQEFFDIVKGERTQLDEYWCKGKIIHVYNNEEWHYMACGKCRKATKLKEKEYFCKYCNEVAENPFEMYKLAMEIQDSTTNMMICGFDEVIKNIFDISVDEMLGISVEENGNEKVENYSNQLLEKETSFLIKIRPYNWDRHDTSSMSVIMIKEIDELKELKKKVKESRKSGKIFFAPITPIKYARKFIDVDDDVEEDEDEDQGNTKKNKKIKEEPKD